MERQLQAAAVHPIASSSGQATSWALTEVLGPSTKPKTEEGEGVEKEEEEEEDVKRGQERKKEGRSKD